MTKRKPDPLWDVAVALCDGGGKGPITKTERGMWNKGLKDIRDAGGTPEQLRAAVATYRRKHKGYPCHPMTLAKHWGQLLADGAPETAQGRWNALWHRWNEVPHWKRDYLAEKVGCTAAELSLPGYAVYLRRALVIWDKEQR